MADEVDDAGEAEQVAGGLAYVCGHLNQIRADLHEDEARDPSLVERLLVTVRDGKEIAGLLDALHDALIAGGDALGVYGHVRHAGTRGLRPAGVEAGPLELIYVCPVGRCTRYHWPEAADRSPRCGISGENLRRERL